MILHTLRNIHNSILRGITHDIGVHHTLRYMSTSYLYIYTMTYIRTEICICQNWKALIGTPKQLTSVWSHRSRIMNLKFQHHILNMFQHHVPWPLAWPRLPHWPRGRQRQETWWPKFAAVAGRRGLSTSCCMVWKKLETWVTSSLRISYIIRAAANPQRQLVTD